MIRCLTRSVDQFRIIRVARTSVIRLARFSQLLSPACSSADRTTGDCRNYGALHRAGSSDLTWIRSLARLSNRLSVTVILRFVAAAHRSAEANDCRRDGDCKCEVSPLVRHSDRSFAGARMEVWQHVS
jgi:hypothetical protein